jgi:hypothetical protein
MENNQNRSSQPQNQSNQNTQRSTSSSSGNNSSSQNSRSNFSGSNQHSSSSVGGMNLGAVTQQIQKYSEPIMNKVNSLSTTQKVIGGTLIAAGAGWLALNSKKSPSKTQRSPGKKY